MSKYNHKSHLKWFDFRKYIDGKGAIVNISSKFYIIGHQFFLPSILFFFFFLFMFIPVAYGSAQARGGIRTSAEAYATATSVSWICEPHHSLQQRWILNLLNKAMDLPASSGIVVRFLIHWAEMGTPLFLLFWCPYFLQSNMITTI